MKKNNLQSLEKYIAAQTAYSRRTIFELIRQKRVTVNETIVTSITHKINPGTDDIRINNKRLQARKITFYYYKFNKPKNIITTIKDPEGRPDISQYLHKIHESCFPVGRLDRHTKGLLLFTNDGEWANKILHPRYEIEKKYRVTLDRAITRTHIQRLLTGIMLDDGPVNFSNIDELSKTELIVTLSIGRNRIVRRTFDHLGYEVVGLKRLSIGPIELGGLNEGEFKPLSRSEMTELDHVFRHQIQQIDDTGSAPLAAHLTQIVEHKNAATQLRRPRPGYATKAMAKKHETKPQKRFTDNDDMPTFSSRADAIKYAESLPDVPVEKTDVSPRPAAKTWKKFNKPNNAKTKPAKPDNRKSKPKDHSDFPKRDTPKPKSREGWAKPGPAKKRFKTSWKKPDNN